MRDPTLGGFDLRPPITGRRSGGRRLVNFRKPILIVEDDTDIAEACKELLEDEGYRVEVAGTGEQAISFLENEEQPCLVLLDLRLPDIQGNELIEAVEQRVSGHAPIVVATALQLRVPTRHKVLHKPYDLDELLRIVRAYGCETEPAPAAVS